MKNSSGAAPGGGNELPPRKALEAVTEPNGTAVATDGTPGETAQGLDIPALFGASYSEELLRYQRRKSRRRLRIFAVLVLLPTLLSALYFGFIVTPRYLSQAQVVVQSSEGARISSMLDTILGSTGASNLSYVLAEYILSPALLSRLDERFGLRAHYSQEWVDPLSRLGEDASRADMLDYWKRRVTVNHDTAAEVITVEVEAFDAATAQSVANAIIAEGERLVNMMSAKAREDSLAFSRGEVAMAEDNLRRLRREMKAFRDRHGEIDPAQGAGAITGIVTEMEGRLAAARAELRSLNAYMQAGSPKVVELKTRISALEEQIEQERERLASATHDDRRYSDVLAEYEELLTEETFARRAYEAATVSLEMARAEAARQHAYVVDFVPATLPDSAERPERLFMILTVFIGAFVGYLLVAFAWSAVNEQVGS